MSIRPTQLEEQAVTRSWLRSASDPSVSERLEAVYAMVADQIAARGPRCWSTGRCCNFAEWGHRLYVTGLEAAYAVTRLPPGMPLDQSSLSAAESRGDCPFLQMKLCGIHTIKPMGCRVYFCDRDVQEWQHGVSERAVDMIRRIHDELDLQYRYGEWRAILRRFVHLTPE